MATPSSSMYCYPHPMNSSSTDYMTDSWAALVNPLTAASVSTANALGMPLTTPPTTQLMTTPDHSHMLSNDIMTASMYRDLVHPTPSTASWSSSTSMAVAAASMAQPSDYNNHRVNQGTPNQSQPFKWMQVKRAANKTPGKT